MQGNVFTRISKEWFLIAAGKPADMNMMTASWGALGELWGKEVAFCFIRPTRHTLGFVEREQFFTLNFFGEGHRDALNLCGSKSGRDLDKVQATGLTPVACEAAGGAPYFAEAKLVLACRKLYVDDIRPECFLDPELEKKNYGLKDYHRVFVGEIVQALSAE